MELIDFVTHSRLMLLILALVVPLSLIMGAYAYSIFKSASQGTSTSLSCPSGYFLDMKTQGDGVYSWCSR